ncbi:MAG: hypothetical protein BMS9Abin26_0638 [Gammaproteobacteria bacterium]|nr:MAG: hypothetical protein BMS9Abin26_0638 [Gammaproteobacteria bacterium]
MKSAGYIQQFSPRTVLSGSDTFFVLRLRCARKSSEKVILARLAVACRPGDLSESEVMGYSVGFIRVHLRTKIFHHRGHGGHGSHGEKHTMVQVVLISP